MTNQAKAVDLAEENRILRLGNALLRDTLKECSDQLADLIDRHYAAVKDKPEARYCLSRDMATVIVARLLLDGEVNAAPKRKH